MEQPIPDTRMQLLNLVNALRLAVFPKVLWKCADATARDFVPTQAGLEMFLQRIGTCRNDADLRHWLSEGAEISDLIYCRMALHCLGNRIEEYEENDLRLLSRRIILNPMLVRIVDIGGRILMPTLKA